ncbi:hypothetical protein ABZX85_39745 [Streptomyces sp. NPDC004539]|uniref:hypothetical protein n=1 Tax=Streptomyces sp. NPDC004539 TaxID=3154280 RepID=UPI0033ACD62F
MAVPVTPGFVGIEGDQVVYEYLSSAGDLAQQRQSPSGERMRLASGLREVIDRRARAPVDSLASVRRILDRVGTLADVVADTDTLAPATAKTATVFAPFPSDGDPDPPPMDPR